MIAAEFIQGIAACGSAALCVLFYKYIAYKEFGGTTGDLCGWFLQICEITMLGAAVLAQLLTGGGI